MIDLMLQLKGTLEFTLKAIEDVQEDVQEGVNAVEGALGDSCEGTPTFEV